MNEEIVEFECTDCGATVPTDAKSCPKCGASFEETLSNGPNVLPATGSSAFGL